MQYRAVTLRQRFELTSLHASPPWVSRTLRHEEGTVIRHEGTDSEARFEVDAHVQPKKGFFAVDTPIYEGDVVVVPDPRGGVDRRIAKLVEVFDHGPKNMQNTEVTWGKAPPSRTAPVRRLALEKLHPEVIAAASDLFVDGHYSQAVFESLKALEQRVRDQSGLDGSGRDLMTKAFSGNLPPIDVSIEAGQSGRDEQEGLRFVFHGNDPGGTESQRARTCETGRSPTRFGIPRLG